MITRLFRLAIINTLEWIVNTTEGLGRWVMTLDDDSTELNVAMAKLQAEVAKMRRDLLEMKGRAL